MSLAVFQGFFSPPKDIFIPWSKSHVFHDNCVTFNSCLILVLHRKYRNNGPTDVPVTNPLHSCAQAHRLHVSLRLTLSPPPWRLFCSWLVCRISFIFRCRPSAILSNPLTFIRWEKVCPFPHCLILFSRWQSGCGGSPSSGYPAVTRVAETNQVWNLLDMKRFSH